MPWLVERGAGLVLKVARREVDLAAGLVVGRALIGVLAVAERDCALIRERAAGLILEVAGRKVDVAAGLVVGRALVDVLAVAERDCALIGERAAGLILEMPAVRLMLPPMSLLVAPG